MNPILIERDHPLRKEAEALIREIYLCEYDAEIETFSDLLIGLPDGVGGLAAVAGLRIGGDFFSEVYLDGTIEQELSKYWQPTADRATIAEVTTLAACHPKSSHLLYQGIIEYLRTIGMRFAFFTVTERLYAMLKRSGVPAQVLASARPERITNSEAWGSYYHSNPKVVAVHDSFVTMPSFVPFGVAAWEALGKAANQSETLNIA